MHNWRTRLQPSDVTKAKLARTADHPERRLSAQQYPKPDQSLVGPEWYGQVT